MKAEKSVQKPVTPTPSKKRAAKAAGKELKSTGKKMTDKEFKQFCAAIQSAGVSSQTMPKMQDKAP